MISNSQLLLPKTTKSLSYKVGKRIKYYRERKRYSQVIFGAMVGMSPKIIDRYEAGECFIALETLEKFARGLGVSVGELVEGEGENGSTNPPTPLRGASPPATSAGQALVRGVEEGDTPSQGKDRFWGIEELFV